MKARKYVGDVPDDYIPRDADDMVRAYNPFVAMLIRRYNKIPTNFEDLLQHVWMKLCEVRIIDKYHAQAGSLPKRMTAEEACSYCRITFRQWKVSLWRASLGDYREANGVKASRELIDSVFERDHGVCCQCSRDTMKVIEALEILKVREPELHTEKRQALFTSLGIPLNRQELWMITRKSSVGKASKALEDLQTTCLFCVRRTRTDWAPKPLEGGWASKKAVYSREDVERYKTEREANTRSKVHTDLPEVAPLKTTKGPFKAYLARAVHNTYANWCRTRSRRYKEHYLAPMEDGQAWESFLEDPNACEQEALTELYHAVKLAGSGEQYMQDVDFEATDNQERERQVFKLLSEGYLLEDVMKKLNLSKDALVNIRKR